MISDPDIYCAAILVIDQYGQKAGDFAATRADQLLDDGDLEGSAIWGPELTELRPPLHRLNVTQVTICSE